MKVNVVLPMFIFFSFSRKKLKLHECFIIRFTPVTNPIKPKPLYTYYESECSAPDVPFHLSINKLKLY